MNIAVSRSDNSCDVAIIGAGPYGLAAAAHLRAVNVPVRVFGEAMSFWRHHMPSGMKLRSPWIATHIADPLSRYRLDDYFGETGLPLPELLPVENFIDYGAWFQSHVAPDLDTRTVVRVAPRDGGFRLVLEDGENVFARRVVMAIGLLNHEHRPAQFDGLPRSLVSHSCEHTEFRAIPWPPRRSHRPRTERVQIGGSAARGRRGRGNHLSRTLGVERRPGRAGRFAQRLALIAGKSTYSAVSSRAVSVQLAG